MQFLSRRQEASTLGAARPDPCMAISMSTDLPLDLTRLRAAYADGIFRVGNVAGESHPIIAEGISMALQSGWLLASELARVRDWDEAGREMAGHRYAAAWHSQFALRILTASVLADIASRPLTARLMRGLVSAFPASLFLGARMSGKVAAVPGVG